MSRQCGTLAGNHFLVGVCDDNGCILPAGLPRGANAPVGMSGNFATFQKSNRQGKPRVVNP